jgi:hypothetical protein
MFGLAETGYIREVAIAGMKAHGSVAGRAADGNQDIGKTAIKVINGTREDGNNGALSKDVNRKAIHFEGGWLFL